jgi:hypothetical protein
MSKLLDSHPLLQTEPAKVVIDVDAYQQILFDPSPFRRMTFNLARPWRRVEGDIEHGQTVLQ